MNTQQRRAQRLMEIAQDMYRAKYNVENINIEVWRVIIDEAIRQEQVQRSYDLEEKNALTTKSALDNIEKAADYAHRREFTLNW